MSPGSGDVKNRQQGREGRQKRRPSAPVQHVAHPPRERLDLLEGCDGFLVQRIGAEQEELRLSENRCKGVGDIVAEGPEPLLEFVGHPLTER